MGQGVQNWLPAVPENLPGGHNAQASASIVVPRSTPNFPGRHCPGHTGMLLPTPGLYVPRAVWSGCVRCKGLGVRCFGARWFERSAPNARQGRQSALEFLPKNAFVVPAGQKFTFPTSIAATAPFA